MTRVIRYIIAGAIGAIIAWGIMEPTALMPDGERSVSFVSIFLIGLISGLFIGLALGFAEGMSGLSPRDAARSALLGAVVGAAGGIVGLTCGQAFYSAMCTMAGPVALGPQLPPDVPVQALPDYKPGFMQFFLLLFGRGFGWALIGAFIGVSPGLATGSTKKMINGAIGGLIGGGIGGSVFEILVWMNRGGVANFPPPTIRFISFAITGAAIGLFIGIIEEFAKQAWLIRTVGLNEGKHYDLYKTVTLIGRSEYADIPIYTDPDVVERHASISVLGKSYAIEDLGSAFGTSINGAKITKTALKDGDQISVGKTKFIFRDKATAIAGTSYNVSNSVGVNIPTSQHICQFCGAIKDANGNCDCTVGASPASPIGQQQQAQQPTVQQPPMQAQQPTMQPFGVSSPLGGVDLTAPTMAAAQSARFMAMSGPYSGQAFPVKTGETHIGREATKDIGLPMDTTVSRNHARIAQEASGFVLYDMGSTNGTFVNGAKITRKELVVGDMVQIGNTKFRFEQ